MTDAFEKYLAQSIGGILPQGLIRPAQRPGVQPPRARCIGQLQNSTDLAREAVGWNTVFGGSRRFPRSAQARLVPSGLDGP